MKISKIIFYDEPAIPEIDLDGLVEFARDVTNVKIEKRRSILSYGNPRIAAEMTRARITNMHVPLTKDAPVTGGRLGDKKQHANDHRCDTPRPDITCYDGIELHGLFSDIISSSEMTLDVFHLIFTDKLCCTYSDGDYRYHGRAVICSNPSIISTTGMIEAPAKPRQYYIDRMINARIGRDAGETKYAGAFLEYHDKRLAAVSRIYFLQALLYYVSGEPFCDMRDCMLYNSHWQSELLHSQRTGMLCKKHKSLLESVNNLN